MRHLSTGFLLLSLCSAPLCGQAGRGPPPKPTPIPIVPRTVPAAESRTQTQLIPPIKLEDEWTKALVKRDTRTFDRLLAPGFVYTEDASVMSRDDVIKSVTGPDRVEWARNEGMTVHDFGDVQVITGVLHLRGKGKQGPFDRRYRFTDTWHRQNERIRADGRIVATNDSSWQIIAAQDYLIPK
jgi:ketosteroid isomerase-like protein